MSFLRVQNREKKSSKDTVKLKVGMPRMNSSSSSGDDVKLMAAVSSRFCGPGIAGGLPPLLAATVCVRRQRGGSPLLYSRVPDAAVEAGAGSERHGVGSAGGAGRAGFELSVPARRELQRRRRHDRLRRQGLGTAPLSGDVRPPGVRRLPFTHECLHRLRLELFCEAVVDALQPVVPPAQHLAVDVHPRPDEAGVAI